jgi:ribosomal protein L32
MGKPKKRTSPRRTGTRRSHLVLKLARAVNAKSPIKVFTTRRESAKKNADVEVKTTAKKTTKKTVEKAA